MNAKYRPKATGTKGADSYMGDQDFDLSAPLSKQKRI